MAFCNEHDPVLIDKKTYQSDYTTHLHSTTDYRIIMSKVSAGVLLYRKANSHLEVLLVHPGGPFWKNKDDGAWTIPKGETNNGEELLSAAIREFHEETGMLLSGSFIELNPVKQKSGKLVHAWALEGDIDENKIKSNIF